ncbi:MULTISPECIES: hypothetical protein [unclassified Campylobacter]|uniref:hypothetical protein n=1 Tax=unclassified Campylobacter TaxID=2593542 RepID=UPI0022E9B5D6|nr:MULTISPECIES: hypothetical protein [unclassified Campylobacter]MDA3042751.1 hypothetical protein [Campylobacter sp. JMF_09 ED2]MDA3063760.1 hypothetical protein [Campylobacter sp. JMF_11 EL3]MDA3071389.1 hypothetical protein [Campylobacter sp. VBCF_03 NA9]MDA3074849.1 hypothetical protein [Campylobacter sp. JMF_05 ED3]
MKFAQIVIASECNERSKNERSDPSEAKGHFTETFLLRKKRFACFGRAVGEVNRQK